MPGRLNNTNLVLRAAFHAQKVCCNALQKAHLGWACTEGGCCAGRASRCKLHGDDALCSKPKTSTQARTMLSLC